MKIFRVFFILTVLFFIHLNGGDQWPELKGPYMGQNPPGTEPEIFLPGILSNKKVGAFCTVFSLDGAEFYFTYYVKGGNSANIYWMKQTENFWGKPEKLPFNSENVENDVCISSNGNRLVFRSWRALPNGKKPKDHSWLWVAERTGDSWSEAKPLLCGGEPVRTGYPSLSKDDTLYFAHRQDGRVGIYRASLQNGRYGKPEFVYEAFNQDFVIGDLFVAPDESYIIFSGRPPVKGKEFGRLDLYITFRYKREKWSEPLKMENNISTKKGSENCPAVSPDGKHFFFNRYDPDKKWGDMYWVDARIIEKIRQKIK